MTTVCLTPPCVQDVNRVGVKIKTGLILQDIFFLFGANIRRTKGPHKWRNKYIGIEHKVGLFIRSSKSKWHFFFN